MRNSIQMLVACSFESASKTEVEEYVYSIINGEKEYSNIIFEALTNDVKKARGKLEEYLRAEHADFVFTSEQGIVACESELIFQIRKLLNKESSQEEFRFFFISMESQLLGFEISWGDLWNACDCFDENWNFLESDYLLEEAGRVLDNLVAEQASG